MKPKSRQLSSWDDFILWPEEGTQKLAKDAGFFFFFPWTLHTNNLLVHV